MFRWGERRRIIGKMSMTTLGSASRDSASGVLYEEESENRSAEQTRSDNKSGGMADELVKSENTILIETFLTHFLRYRSPHCNVRRRRREQRADNNVMDCVVVVQDFEIDRMDPSFEDMEAILSEILTLKVRYKVVAGETAEDKVGFFIVKVPATNVEDRQLATMAGVDHREILFYSQTVPDIREWLKSRRIELDLSLAQCYHARYDRPLEELPVPGIIEHLSRAESIIILEDLRPQGFGKRHYAQALNLCEVKTALREICKVHATTWAMQELGGRESLTKMWGFSYKPEYGAMLYEALLEDGLPRFEQHLKDLVEANRDMEAARILERLILLRSRGLRNVLYKLLMPVQPPAPTSLVHMDFWADNIFFRKKEEGDFELSGDKPASQLEMVVEPNTSSGNNAGDGSAKDSLECRILDWQMFSIGRPTHDIALLLFTSLDPPTRKDSTDGLLEFYYKTFRSIAGKFGLSLPFDLSVIYDQFRRSQLLAVLQVIASIDLVLQDEATQDRLMGALLELIQGKVL